MSSFWNGKVRQQHGHYAQGRDDFQAAVCHLTSFLEYVERAEMETFVRTGWQCTSLPLPFAPPLATKVTNAPGLPPRRQPV